MKRTAIFGATALAFLLTTTALSPLAPAWAKGMGTSQAGGQQQAHFGQLRIDVAFLLDTTGSMTDLIQGAKVKIWSIATEMLRARVTPDIRFALIGYRDRGDRYVTLGYDLTRDIDDIYGELLQFEADGGGDRPESVNQALDEAVNDLSWDRGRDVYRVVFLVGDSPPKMGYYDDVKYDVTARLARQQDVVINTLLAGGAQDTGKIWREIARLSHGHYSEIPQSGGMQIIETPYDQDIQSLTRHLNETALPYGGQEQRDSTTRKLEQTLAAPSSVTADKMTYLKEKGTTGEIVTGAGELLGDLESKRVRLDDLEESDLPAELQGLSAAERDAVISEKQRLRAEIQGKIDRLLDSRDAYLEKEQARLLAEGGTDSFDREVADTIRAQGAKKGIIYE